ncbi:hypothetical protein HDE69_004973 [Pedobacter cryoconitis]|uniref:Uncharacterized protein n=1 Tax=Pedobacter cryoconitis TaxID=188932 RepID=A0A7W8YY26_9SPHI|nr:hypothetical protein [Pedobacter cryoconitis]MBB5623885.1 hypothetical protein [Pedobacter cryoconitis]
MKHLQEIYTALNLKNSLIELSNGNISIPYLDTYNKPDKYWYPHPPVLIPLFLGHGAFYYGVLKHFFIERDKTFVEYSLEWGYMLEFARNTDQIYSQMVLDMDMVSEGLDDKILAFCKEIGFDDSSDVDSFADDYGNIIDDYDKLINLVNDTPLTYVKNLSDYTGDYPSSEKLFNLDRIQDSCSFEIVDQSFTQNISNLPEWLKKGVSQKVLFDKYVANKDLKSAWLTLNSTGWKLTEAAKGLEVLKSLTDDNLFHLVADNWIDGFENSEFTAGSY